VEFELTWEADLKAGKL
jgi:hypothetical protein